ncbi:MAG TPA: hypothetical protein VG916_10775 [Gemmatimonadaceae bacterium]|nr:hypothetical protein [Gemmatimonadaceae bacterium]
MRIQSLKVLAVASTLVASVASAQAPVQVALFNPAQIIKEGDAVDGVRLSVFYTKNTDVDFVDLGIGYNLTTGNGMGVQWALVPHTKGTFSGWQSGFVAVTEGMFTGLQQGVVTKAGKGKGVQYGLVNVAQSWHGLQLGAVNLADNMNEGGLQIGLVNVIKTGGRFPVFPIVNWKF